MANRYGQAAMDDLIILNELQQYTQPYTTGVSQFIPSEGEFEAKRLNEMIAEEGSIQQGPQYVEAGVPSWLVDITTGGATKGVSILKRLLGSMKSKKKFPIGYGKPTKTPADEALKLLEDFGPKGKVPKPPPNPIYEKIAKFDKSTLKKLSDEGLSTLPLEKFNWTNEQWKKYSDITGISLDELLGKTVDWSEPLW